MKSSASLCRPDVSPNAQHLHPKKCIDTVMGIDILSQESWGKLEISFSRQSFGLIRPLLKLLHPSKTVSLRINSLIFMANGILPCVEVVKQAGSKKVGGEGGVGGSGRVWSYLRHCPPPVGRPVIASWILLNSGHSFILRHPLKRYVFERNRKWMEFSITSDFFLHISYNAAIRKVDLFIF